MRLLTESEIAIVVGGIVNPGPPSPVLPPQYQDAVRLTPGECSSIRNVNERSACNREALGLPPSNGNADMDLQCAAGIAGGAANGALAGARAPGGPQVKAGAALGGAVVGGAVGGAAAGCFSGG